jgi:hypothetical protein
MFREIDGRRYYSGPTFRSCLHPATWATDEVSVSKTGRPKLVLRDHFKDMWAYIEEADVFVCTEMPEILRNEPIANKMLAPFSQSAMTTQLIVKAYTGRSTRICYRPDVRGRLVTDRGTSAINLHTPTQVKAVEGDVTPFINFMAYMFPKEEERTEMLKWCATLIAHPEIRMEYGVLLVTVEQGIGKTTLGAEILAPLMGFQNVGFPNESDIVDSQFNGWMANKRLIVINEIYSGHSFKAYNLLKTYITDNSIQVNEKFQRSYLVDNWVHIFACSNSAKALKLDDNDRRWFVPEVNEERWEKGKFDKLYSWLRSGGLGIIKHWAQGYNNIVARGERAPMTGRKQEFIEDSRSDAEKELIELGRNLVQLTEPAALCDLAIKYWVRQTVDGARLFETAREMRDVIKEQGAFEYRYPLKIQGRMQKVVMNEKLKELIEAKSDPVDQMLIIRNHLKSPNDILGSLI